MSPRRKTSRYGGLTRDDLAAWAEQEELHARKALELRIKGAKQIEEDFAKKRITSEDAAELMYQHEKRWGEALPGIFVIGEKTDEEILAKIDERRRRQEQVLMNLSSRARGRDW